MNKDKHRMHSRHRHEYIGKGAVSFPNDPDKSDDKPNPNNINNDSINNWNPKNEETIKSWKLSVSRISFIYSLVTNKYNKRLSSFLLSAFIINSIISTLTAIKILLNVIDDDWVQSLRLAFDIILLILSTLVTILSGTVKMLDWQTFVNTCTKYIERLEALFAPVAAILLISPNLREDADSFITRTDRTYLDLMRKHPQISRSDYNAASVKYDKFIKQQAKSNESIESYFENDSIIDIF